MSKNKHNVAQIHVSDNIGAFIKKITHVVTMVDAGGFGKAFKALLSSIGGLMFMLVLFGGGDIVVDTVFLLIGGREEGAEEQGALSVEDVEIQEPIVENADVQEQPVKNTKVQQSSHAPIVVALPFFILAGVVAVWFLRHRRS